MSFFDPGYDFSGNSIWAQGTAMFAMTSPVSTILEKESFTLEELLEEDELLQEVKAMSPKLLEFLAKVENVKKMVGYITTPAQSNDSDVRKFKYPYISCEVICCEISQIIDTLVEGENGGILEHLFDILELPPPLDAHLAGYLNKIVSLLVVRRSENVNKVINNYGMQLFTKFSQHLDSYSIAQLVKRLLEPPGAGYQEYPVEMGGMMSMMMSGGLSGFGGMNGLNTPSLPSTPVHVTWHEEPLIIDLLVAKLRPTDDDGKPINGDVHEHTAEILVDIVKNSCRASFADGQATAGSNGLLASLQRKETLESLVEAAIPREGVEVCNSSMVASLTVLAEILSMYVNSSYSNSAEETLPVAVQCTLPRLPEVAATLRGETYNPGVVRNQMREEQPRLGLRRLKLVYLVGLLLHCKLRAVDEEICKLGLLKTCIDLFFEFQWANMLHSYIEHICATVFESNSSVLLNALFVEAKLLSRILDTYAEAERIKSTPGAFQKGNLGHLHHIARVLHECTEDGRLDETQPGGRDSASFLEVISILHDDPRYSDWESFVKTTLAEVEALETANNVQAPSLTESSFSEDLRSEGQLQAQFAQLLDINRFQDDDFDQPESGGRSSSDSEDDDMISSPTSSPSKENDGFDPFASSSFGSFNAAINAQWPAFDEVPISVSAVNRDAFDPFQALSSSNTESTQNPADFTSANFPNIETAAHSESGQRQSSTTTLLSEYDDEDDGRSLSPPLPPPPSTAASPSSPSSDPPAAPKASEQPPA